jgi:hypothetical protein
MNELTDTDQIADTAAVESPPIAGDFLAAEDLEAWRRTALPGESVVYYTSTASLMRARVKDAALDRTATVALGIYDLGRGSPVQAKIGDGRYEYRLQFANTAPPAKRL